MLLCREIAAKELIDARANEFAGRQADTVHDDEIDVGVRGPGVMVRTQDLPCANEQSRLAVYAWHKGGLVCCHGA